jgi:DNA (cytosine-5)-methyltransferase 1
MSLARSTGGNSFFSWVRASWDAPCMTIQKSVTFGGFSVWHPQENRSMTGREIARVGSWPDGYSFIGEYKDWINRIGNSVPPLFMRSIALHVRREILAKV